MDDNIRDYIDSKFDKLTGVLKWIGAALITILMGMGSVVIANKIQVSNQSFKIEVIKSAQDEQLYKLMWIIELQEIQRDFLKAIKEDEDINDFLDKLEELEKKVTPNNYIIKP